MSSSSCLPRSGRPALRLFLSIPVSAGLFLLVAGCGQSPESLNAEKAAAIAKTTGALVVHSNRPNASVEATALAPSGETPFSRQGPAGVPLTGLLPGQYAVVVSAPGWPRISDTATVTTGQTAELTLHHATGALQLDSEPAGATVKLGGEVLGQTPLLLPELPAGDTELQLEFKNWPPLAFKASIPAGAEIAAKARLPHGRLVVDSVPAGAMVRIGGTDYGRTPLTLEQVPAGPKRLVLLAEKFPPVAVSFTLEDRADFKVRPELGSVFPPLDPTEVIKTSWVPDDPNKLAPSFDSVGKFEPRNGIVKNINRRKVFNDWIGKTYRYSGVVETYDRKTGEIDFVEDKSALSRYRVVAIVSPEVRSGLEPVAATLKGKTMSVYGSLAAVEEPRWPARAILLELTGAQLLDGENR